VAGKRELERVRQRDRGHGKHYLLVVGADTSATGGRDVKRKTLGFITVSSHVCVCS